MRSIVVGTAGHIDHGKTSLVRALTGIDTDRLEEEKRRGISIDLGFAHLRLTEQLRVAFIDVPGHERFIKNMLAGVGGIDLVLLVIAADESIKPQTREHFDICRLLRIPGGLVALTKADLVDNDILELVRLETDEFLAGSFLAGAPIVPVSATTGEGLDDLRRALVDVASAVPPRESAHSFRMPVDRVFTMQGFGTVATGTVLSGTIATEEEVSVHPADSRLRVRGIQVHGSSAKRASAGQRAAINLAGSDLESLARGSVLAKPDAFRPTKTLDCLLDLLPSAKPLKNRAPVHFHAGTAEVLAEVRTVDGSQAIRPGATVAARIALKEPLLVIPGDRFIIRMFSPVITIGGGEVVDSFSPRKTTAERTLALSKASVNERIATLVREAPEGINLNELSIRTGLTAEHLKAVLPAGLTFIAEPQPWLIDAQLVTQRLAEWRETLKEYHRVHPLVPGIRREEFRSREMPGAPPFVFDAILGRDKLIASSGEYLHLTAHKLALQHDEEQALSKIEAAFESGGLSVPAVKEVLNAAGVDAARARSLLQILLREKRLVKVAEDLVFHPAALQNLRGMLQERRGERFSVPEFKDWTGVSRKYAIPLLEFLDREHVTRREGDTRTIL
jgi:selenocysteine-specific elongation factor